MRIAALFLVVCSLLLAAPASGRLLLRASADQRGSFTLIGNTLGFDCRPGTPPPIVGAVDRAQCGSATEDAAIDLFWRAHDPQPGAATARLTTTPDLATSQAVLQLPPGATVTYARLYWAGGTSGEEKGPSALLQRPGVFQQRLPADGLRVIPGPHSPDGYLYQASADVTRLVQSHGAGAYQVGLVSSIAAQSRDLPGLFLAWNLVVLYQSPDEPPRALAIYDGLDPVSEGAPTEVTLGGFLVPPGGHDARLAVVAYAGDADRSGDQLLFNDQPLGGSLNPADNFFNGTRSADGRPVSVAGDLPQGSGEAGSGHGYDADVLAVGALLAPGDTRAKVRAASSGDSFYLGVLVSAVSTREPIFQETRMSVVDLTEDAVFKPGDLLEYTVEVKNTGRDDAVGALLQVPLPAGLRYAPGSLLLSAGSGAGPVSDAAGDDAGEYLEAARTLHLRIGEGANAERGGRVREGARLVVRFRATVEAGTRGILSCQASVTAAGEEAIQAGIPPSRTYSTNGTFPGRATVFVVDRCGGGGEDCSLSPVGAVCFKGLYCGCTSDVDCRGGICDLLGNTCIRTRSDLQLTVTSQPDPPQYAVPVTYKLALENLGPDPAPAGSVRVTFDVPFGAEVQEVRAGEGWACQVVKEAAHVLCARAAALPPGAPPDIQVTVLITGDSPDAAVLVGAAEIGEAFDPSRDNNVYITLIRPTVILRPSGGGFGCAAAGGGLPSLAGAGAALLWLALSARRRRAVVA